MNEDDLKIEDDLKNKDNHYLMFITTLLSIVRFSSSSSMDPSDHMDLFSILKASAMRDLCFSDSFFSSSAGLVLIKTLNKRL